MFDSFSAQLGRLMGSVHWSADLRWVERTNSIEQYYV
jgi:hypothetical protein